VTEQQIAPAKANLEYNATPLSFSGVFARVFWTTASTFTEPVEGGAAAIAYVLYVKKTRNRRRRSGDV
jgi:hypothetical protein